MKEAISQLFLNSREIHAPTFAFDIDGGGDNPKPAY